MRADKGSVKRNHTMQQTYNAGEALRSTAVAADENNKVGKEFCSTSECETCGDLNATTCLMGHRRSVRQLSYATANPSDGISCENLWKCGGCVVNRHMWNNGGCSKKPKM